MIGLMIFETSPQNLNFVLLTSVKGVLFDMFTEEEWVCDGI